MQYGCWDRYPGCLICFLVCPFQRRCVISFLTLVPAYGRDYKSKKEVIADWESGKDFQICDISNPDDGRYVNIDQSDMLGKITLNIRYKKLTQSCQVKVK